VLAKGQREPDPAFDVQMQFDGKDVTVPQGKPDPRFGDPNSSFRESEYLVYRESQQRIRYACRFKSFNHVYY
jgi:poly [ADP-ribose] polymerase